MALEIFVITFMTIGFIVIFVKGFSSAANMPHNRKTPPRTLPEQPGAESGPVHVAFPELEAKQKECERIKREYEEFLEEQREYQRQYDEYAAELADLEKQMQIISQMTGLPIPGAQPDLKESGNAFESFAADLMAAQGFLIIERNRDQASDVGISADVAQKPGFRVAFEQSGVSIEFWIECEYCPRLPERVFTLPHDRLDRYIDLQMATQRKVLVLLGVCCTPEDPGTLYLIPVENIKKYNGIKRDYLRAYQLDSREDFRNQIARYFLKTIFKTPRPDSQFSQN